ncbi:lysophospholipase L2 [Neiella marina]|uniref:Lysophospholipase L2 n=1 Tax=Neiella marina TaxID=508461 RepID=A0A8J2U9M0_9GAMM|nr:alpha/beta fold hydrolase [Neiella marina]GGA88985.1 lysophospholipase L2 [Neiella marina]
MNHAEPLTEDDPQRQVKLTQFVERHEQQHIMTGCRGMRLHYVFYPQANKPTIVVAPGRAEAAFKYRELARDFYQRGFQVAVIDHRGQGLSERFFPNRQLGHMDDFEYAAKDLLQLAKRVQFNHQPCYLIAHSMGATIGLRACQMEPGLFARVALMAPMLSLPLPMPAMLMRVYLWWRTTTERIAWRKHRQPPEYISPGRREYHDGGFRNNPLTSSLVRYNAFRQMYEQQPKLQLGGPTSGWLRAALALIATVFSEVDKIDQPMLVALADDERVVTATGQHKLRQRLASSSITQQWLQLEHCRHEPLLEIDAVRTPLIEQIFHFFTTSN